MARAQLFITGATGYIGGSVLTKIVSQYQDLEVVALSRSTSQEFSQKYPHVKIVKGTFDDLEVIEKASSTADIVIHAGDSDHEGSVKAILSGLALRTKNKQKSFLIHLSGTGLISDERDQTWEGKFNPRVWDDVEHIDEINNLPESARHHKVDRWIQDASDEFLKTAIVCPPDIYGQGSAIGGRTTFLVPVYVAALVKHKEAFYLGDGDNMRAVAFIDDVVDVFSLLVEQALKGGGTAQWGNEGFYFTATSEVRWKDVVDAINHLGREQGWLPKDSKPVSWSKERLGQAVPGYSPGLVLYLWGSNSRAQSSRAKAIGWTPSGPSFWETLAGDVEVALKSALAK